MESKKEKEKEQKSNYTKERKRESGGVIRPQAVPSQLQPPTLLSVCVYIKTRTRVIVHVCVYKTVCVVIVLCVRVCVSCRSATSFSSHSGAKSKHSGSHYTHRVQSILRGLWGPTLLCVCVCVSVCDVRSQL